MKERVISEGILITNEIVHSIRWKEVEGIVIKLGFERAFDSVDWEFLFETMECLGFQSKLIFWIKQIFQYMKTSLLVNGSQQKNDASIEY